MPPACTVDLLPNSIASVFLRAILPCTRLAQLAYDPAAGRLIKFSTFISNRIDVCILVWKIQFNFYTTIFKVIRFSLFKHQYRTYPAVRSPNCKEFPHADLVRNGFELVQSESPIFQASSIPYSEVNYDAPKVFSRTNLGAFPWRG